MKTHAAAPRRSGFDHSPRLLLQYTREKSCLVQDSEGNLLRIGQPFR
jgi:hypothetical protein